jgi:hypothetical protein
MIATSRYEWLRPAVPIDRDLPFRAIATTLWTGVTGAIGWSANRPGFAPFHRERGNAWTEITRAQNLRRAEAVRRRHVKTPDRRQSWVSATAARDCILRARRAGLGWPLPKALTDETLEDRLYPSPAVASKERRPQPDWATVHRELRRPGVTLQLLWEEHRAAKASSRVEYRCRPRLPGLTLRS